MYSLLQSSKNALTPVTTIGDFFLTHSTFLVACFHTFLRYSAPPFVTSLLSSTSLTRHLTAFNRKRRSPRFHSRFRFRLQNTDWIGCEIKGVLNVFRILKEQNVQRILQRLVIKKTRFHCWYYQVPKIIASIVVGQSGCLTLLSKSSFSSYQKPNVLFYKDDYRCRSSSLP